MSEHPAVRAAFREGEYTDKRGVLWQKGMDGWFDRSNPELIAIIRHADMANIIDLEARE